ncbi:MAG TPA: murein biosynthesis integral membrane protein MurJ [Blastocatellia bacterium]|jgi:putative peptidoglycan lipid II flippase
MENLHRAKAVSIDAGGLDSLIKKWRRGSGGVYWDRLRHPGPNHNILAAMLTVGALSAVVKLASTAREVVIARQFGAGDGLDAFLIAFLLPSVAINVVAGSFNAALVPTYIQVREREGKEEAQRLLSSVLVWSACLLIAVSVLMALVSPFVLPILGSGFDAEKLALTRRLFFILLPVLPLSGLFVNWAAVLNAGGRFALAATTPIMTPLAMLTIISAFGDSLGIYAAATAMIVGTMTEGALLASGLRKQGVSPIPRWHGFSPATRQVMRQYAPMIASGLLMNGTIIIDQAMAAMLGPGSVSILNYGNRMSAAVIAIGAMAISTAFLPHFSRMAAAADWDGVRRTLKIYTRLILIASIPVTLILIASSDRLVSLLFERGAFTATNTVEVASVQRLYVLQMPIYLASLLFVRLISALRANQILMWGTVINFTLNITLDYALMKWLGVAGIALSTSIVYSVSLSYLYFASRYALKEAEKTSCSVQPGQSYKYCA